jgi:hypothetical protein
VNKKIKIGSRGGVFTLIDKYYKASGGEADIYVNGGRVFKIYHDQHKTLPAKKIQELSLIYNPQVVVPQDLIFDATTGDPLGYTANYVDNVEPLLKLFTRTFKQDNNIDPQMIAGLVKQLQLITNDIHGAHCLIVDFNELNVLVNITPMVLTPYFIDVDSYATPSFKATAIMDSVRDRRVSSYNNGKLIYNPDELSDWFSWGILSFWLYTNIHPFRGNHPHYKPKDKQKQMDDGISVFHRGVKVPPSVSNFNVIPKRHRDWFEAVFLKNERSVPPLPDSLAPLTVPTAIVTIKGTNQIDVIQSAAYSENVVNVFQFMGMTHAVTTKKVYCEDKELMNGCDKVKKTLLCSASDGTVIVASLSGTKVTFTELNRQRFVGTIESKDIFVRNGCIYTISGNGKLVQNKFTAMGDKIIHRITEVENVSIYTTTIHEGMAMQNLLGQHAVVMPYKIDCCFSKIIPQLTGYRVIDAKAERNVVVIIAEKGGQYNRFIIVFKKDYSDFDVRIVKDIAYDGINFTVLENGLCILLANPDELELFGNNQNISVLQNPPFDSTMKLFNTSDGAFFINGNTTHQIKRK